MDEESTTIVYDEKGEDAWWEAITSAQTYQYFLQQHVPRRWEPREMMDCDPGPQPPHDLEPIEHGPRPLLDASEA